MALVLVGCVLRAAAARGPLWLDEIWSLNTASRLASPIDILTVVRHDNNHFLNTLVLFLLGSDWPWIIYRLHSIAAGAAAIVVTGLIVSRRGRCEQIFAMVLTTFAYLLVHYGSEARGYSLLILFSLSTCHGFDRLISTSRVRWAAFLAACGALGFLAHPTFATVYLAGLYWWLGCSLDRWLRRDKSVDGIRSADPSAAGEAPTTPPDMLRTRWVWVSTCLAIPLAVALLLYVVNLRHMELGGGPECSLPLLLVEAASLTLGGPQRGPLAFFTACVRVVAIVIGLRILRFDDNGTWRFFLVVIAAPIILAIATRPPFLFVRYFLVPSTFSLLLVAMVLAHGFRRGRHWRWAACAAVALFVIANSAHSFKLIRVGRGQYPAALQFMADSTRGNEVRFASDHPHGVSILVDFYADRVAPRRRLTYERAPDWTRHPPDWLIMHQYSTGHDMTVPASHQVAGSKYRFRRQFDCAMLSGWQLLCYQRQQ